jgi:hypothetical protein
MDGQTADHLQQAICNYSRDDILTVMWVNFFAVNTPFTFTPRIN